MLILKTVFRSGMKITQVPIAWFRAVSGFLSNIAAGTGIKIRIPATPDGNNPVHISIDESYLDGRLRRLVTEDMLNDRLRDYGNDNGAGGGTSAFPAPEPDSTNVDNTQTGDGGVAGIATATNTTAYHSGDTTPAQTAARIAAQGTGVGSWTAGGTNGLVQYEISRIVPFTMGTGANPTKYAKIFARLVTRNHSGLVVSTGDEVDQNLIIRLY